MIEIWKDIENYKNHYQISNLGRIKTLNRIIKYSNGYSRTIKERILPLSLDKYGYLKITLSLHGKSYTTTIHRLVAKNFISNCDNYLQVNHINGIKTDNNVTNLEWCTHQYNHHHAKITNLKASEEKHGSAKLNKIKILEIRNLYLNKNKVKDIAVLYNISLNHIYDIINKKYWKNIK